MMKSSSAKKSKSNKVTKPNVFYKYYPINQNTLAALETGKIWFSHPSKFNDPYDSDLRYRGPSEEIFRKIVTKYLKQYIAGINVDPGNKYHVRNIENKIKVTKNDDFDVYYSLVKYWVDQGDVPQSIWDQIRDEFGVPADLKKSDALTHKIGIFAMSQLNNNNLLWSHYAEHHKGFCVGYDLNVELDPQIYLHRVKYTEKYHQALKYPFNKSNLMTQLVRKDHIWKYEREWRLISFDYTNQLVKIPGSVAEIYLGANISDEMKRIIIKVAPKKAKLFSMQMDDGVYQLTPSKFIR